MKQLITLAIAILLVHTYAAAQSIYWQKVPSGTAKNLTGISFGNSQVGYISATGGVLLRSINGGQSWSSLAHSGLTFSLGTPDIIHVNFLSATTGYVVVGNAGNPVYTGSLYRTIDSGNTWQAINAGNIAIARTYFFDANNGFCIGSAFFAGKTIVKQTGGAWGPEKQFSFDPSRFLYGIDFRNANTGIVGGDSGYVYRTFNGGVSWDTVKTAVDTTIRSLKYLSDKTIIGGSDNNGGAIIISHDTGRTWQLDINTLTFAYPAIKGIVASRRDSFIAVGHAAFANAGILLWVDSGHIYNDMATQQLNDVTMRDDSTAYAVGDSGLILVKRRPPLSVGGPGGNTADIKVYPNPAPGYCIIEAGYLHSVRLFDAVGRTVLREEPSAKKHTIMFGHLSPGVYILEVAAPQRTPFYQRLVVE
jgi:photosystem II stability/assembly factor-like uncharacterized protein